MMCIFLCITVLLIANLLIVFSFYALPLLFDLRYIHNINSSFFLVFSFSFFFFLYSVFFFLSSFFYF